jgi:hypothetical protein
MGTDSTVEQTARRMATGDRPQGKEGGGQGETDGEIQSAEEIERRTESKKLSERQREEKI